MKIKKNKPFNSTWYKNDFIQLIYKLKYLFTIISFSVLVFDFIAKFWFNQKKKYINHQLFPGQSVLRFHPES